MLSTVISHVPGLSLCQSSVCVWGVHVLPSSGYSGFSPQPKDLLRLLRVATLLLGASEWCVYMPSDGLLFLTLCPLSLDPLHT